MTLEARGSAERPHIDLGKQIINLIGPEGSGKTEIGKMLSETWGRPVVGTSGMLHEFAQTDQTELGEECRQMFAEHRYMDPEMLLEIYTRSFARREDLRDGFVLDGGLRSSGETQGFPQMLKDASLDLPLTIVHLQVPGWMGAGRLIGEGGRNRSDDTIPGVLSRMSAYYDHLGQRVTIAEKTQGWRILRADGKGNLEQVFSNVLEVLKNNPIKNPRLL